MFKFFVCFVIEILHQTTTLQRLNRLSICCILLKFFIKPQQSPLAMCQRSRCILLKFYIKPQRRVRYLLDFSVLRRLSGRKTERENSVEVSLMCFCISKNENTVFQKNSNCCGMSGFARSLLPQKLRMSPYCLSVTDRILVNPAGGIDRRTRLM